MQNPVFSIENAELAARLAGLGVVLLCMAAAITLLPATLAAIGGKIPPMAPVADVAGRFYRLTRWVQSHAIPVGAAAVVVLVLLGAPFLRARFEIGDARTLPPSSEVATMAISRSRSRGPSGTSAAPQSRGRSPRNTLGSPVPPPRATTRGR